MAFEAYRSQTATRSPRRRLTYALSLALHAALIAAGVAYSFWHVEELSPPNLRVTFMSASPPPPPPPPPAGGGAARKKIAQKPKTAIVPTKPPDIVQPRETPPPKPEPKDDDDDDDDQPSGVKGGAKDGVPGGKIGGTPGGTLGGTPGGTPGGTVAAPVVAKLLPPNMGALQKISGADPAFPPALRKPGSSYAVLAKICVSRTGDVESVTIMKKADPVLDANVISAVKGWRFRPLMANNTAVPFCYPATFQFKGQ